MPAVNRPLCHHARLIQLVRRRISQVLADPYHPNMKGYELERVPKRIEALDAALVETQAALPKEAKGVLGPLEIDRLTLNEVITVRAMLERAGCRPDNPERGCICEEREADLHAVTTRIAAALSEEHVSLYGLLGLAAAVLALHKGLGLTPSTEDDGTDWTTFSTEDLHYLDAIIRKAKGSPLKPPTNGIRCSVCEYSTANIGRLNNCPVGCPNIVLEDIPDLGPGQDCDPLYSDE